MMDVNPWLKSIFEMYPFLLIVGPLTGILVQKVKETGAVTGFGSLFLAFSTSVLVISAYGLAEGWTTNNWHKLPFAVLVSVATSNLVGNTVAHVQGTLRERSS